MRKVTTIIMSVALTLMAAAVQAASLTPVQVDAAAITCVFSPNCTNVVEDSSSPITLPGTVGTGSLQTRVILGESNSPAARLFGYEYRIDLSAVTLDPAVPPCFTNVLQCLTNRVEVSLTNVVVCRTNATRASKVVTCITNTIPRTNIVFCVTNSFPETNIVHCHTNAAGAVVCFTNNFPATDYVQCFTNRVPQRSIVTCQTNQIPGGDVVTCATNNIRYFTNIVTCATNTVPCPESTPCIKTMTINFGPIVSQLDFDTNGTSTDQVYVVSTGGLGTLAPSAITLTGGKLALRFSPPLCPGDSSFSVGLVSRGAPRDGQVRLALSNASNVVAAARAPQVVRPIDCDFSKLVKEIQGLRSRDILGANNSAREARRVALLELVGAAKGAAQAGNAEDVLSTLAAILDKTDGTGGDWLASEAAHKVNKIITDISKCLGDHEDHHDGDKDDDDDDDDNGHHR